MLSRGSRLRAEQRVLDEIENTDRWIVSYADFITLLFAFFVVMYSISSVNDGKFRVLSDTMTTVFNDTLHRPVPIDLGGYPDGLDDTIEEITSKTILDPSEEEPLDIDLKPLDVQSELPLYERMTNALTPLLDDNEVVVRDGQLWLEIALPSELLFGSGSATLSESADTVISAMVSTLSTVDTPIRVEGFTDNVPINGGRYSSNWQLSAARAAALVDKFNDAGIDPKILSAIGYGEFHPIATNDTVEGRRTNRRVVVAIAKHASVAGGAPVQVVNASAAVPTQTLQRITKLPDAIGLL